MRKIYGFYISLFKYCNEVLAKIVLSFSVERSLKTNLFYLASLHKEEKKVQLIS